MNTNVKNMLEWLEELFNIAEEENNENDDKDNR
jgi:hypothetical protein